MKQPLIHLYFYTVLEKLQTQQFSLSQLVIMINETEEVYRTIYNNFIYVYNTILKYVTVNLEIERKLS